MHGADPATSLTDGSAIQSGRDGAIPPAAAPSIDTRTRTLLEGPIVNTPLRLATPNVLVMFVQASVGRIETYFDIRRRGESGQEEW